MTICVIDRDIVRQERNTWVGYKMLIIVELRS
jgi:hypothetical protein